MSSRNKKYQNYGNEIFLKFQKKKNHRILKITYTEKCSICCEKKEQIKYVNCIRKGVQKHNFGKYAYCCKDKPICYDCRSRCREECPFCKNHKLYNIKKKRFPKKKLPFIEREKKRLEKIQKKEKQILKKERQKLKLKNQIYRSNFERIKLRFNCIL